jgi:hypothetical protein
MCCNILRPSSALSSLSIRKTYFLTLTLAGLVLIAGCGLGGNVASNTAATSSSAVATITGSVHGGQQPIVGSTISLYAAGKSGTGSTPRSMLTGAPILTGNGGSFSITGQYSCQPGDQVYLVAAGGDAGAGPNSAIAMMAALGPCSTLLQNAATSFITVNEVSTIGSVFALAAYMNGAQALGSAPDTASSNALAAAFANVQTIVDISSGSALQTSTGNGIVPQTTIDALANSLAACIDSTGAGSSGCTGLFQNTTIQGIAPSDTLQATLNIARNPTQNASQIFSLAVTNSPFQPSLTSAPSSFAITVAHPSDVLLYHNDIARDGVQSAETTLNPSNVTSAKFGKIATFAIDGTSSYLYAQPLYAGGIGMPDGLVHNLLFASTSRGSVYAFDADGNNPSAGYLWHVSLVPSGERYPTTSDYFGCGNPEESGIVGTPVIDRASQTLYVVVKTVSTSGATFYHRLHALSLIDGSERSGSPLVINPTFTGTGDGSSGGSIPFNGQTQNERSALLITPNATGGKTVWISYASHCDHPPYHGIILGYDSSSLSQTAAFIDTPNGSDGGIWMSNGGLSADSAGYIYALTGNGTFDIDTGGTDYGDAALKLSPPTIGAASPLMSVSDYFVPSNQAYLNDHDLDIGGAEGIVFTDPGSGVAPNLMVASDKNGSVYLINRDNMSHYETGPGNSNNDIQDFTAGGTFIYNFAFYNNILYTSVPLKALTFNPGTLMTAGSFTETPLAQTGLNYTAPVVSANSSDPTSTIVWTQDSGGGLHAFTAGLYELYNTGQVSSRDTPAPFVKFTSPVIANGKVYLSGQGAINVYGPLP